MDVYYIIPTNFVCLSKLKVGEIIRFMFFFFFNYSRSSVGRKLGRDEQKCTKHSESYSGDPGEKCRCSALVIALGV